MDGFFRKGGFCRHHFDGFGSSRFHPGPQPPERSHVKGTRPGQLRSGIREKCPRLPGVYVMVGGGGEVLYVGKAKCLRSRLASYFRPKSRVPKAGVIVHHARVILWEVAPNEFAALLRELELIQRWRPRYNVQGQPGRRRWTYLCLGRGPASCLFLTRHPPQDTLACYGPIRSGRRAQEAVRRCHDWFRLRDCPRTQKIFFSDQQELFPSPRTPGCLRFEIGTCLGPCAAGCSRAAYALQVKRTRAFLEGTHLTPLKILERDMAAASTALEFERAADLRNRLESLRWLHQQLENTRRSRLRRSFIYAASCLEDRTVWYLIQYGMVVGAVPEPQDLESGQAAAGRIEAVYQGNLERPGPGPGEEIDGLLLVSSWFQRHPEERNRLLGVNEALGRCRELERKAVMAM